MPAERRFAVVMADPLNLTPALLLRLRRVARRRRSIAAAIVAVVAVLSASNVSSAATGSFGAAKPGRPVLQWLPEEFTTNHSYTQDQAVAAAQRYDVIVAYPQAFQPYLQAMRAANPDLVLLVYMNGMFASPTQGSAFPADWYSYDANGVQVQNAKNKNYLMNPSNAGWVQNRATTCASLLAQSGYDGCMLDTLGIAPLTNGYCTGLPINPATNAAWTHAAWISGTTALASSVRSSVSPSLVTGNGLKDGPTLGESGQLLNGLDGAVAEGFLRTSNQGVGAFPALSAWQANVNMLVTASKPVLVLTKLWVSATAQQVDQWHSFALASFLLGTNGTSYFYYTSSSTEAPVATVPWTVNIGDPAGSYAAQDGVYQRQFTNGLVLVNPSTSPVTVPLSGSYVDDHDGASVGGALTMAPETGSILRHVTATLPDAPTGVSAVAGDGSAVVSFSVPQNDGGSPITRHTVTALDATTPANGGQTASGTGSPISIGGLMNGDSYSFTVTATNGVGDGSSSTPSNTVVPTSVPPVTITTASIPFGVVNLGYNGQLTAAGGTAPYTWSVESGTLPTGVTLSQAGSLSGTPTRAGSYAFTVSATDSSGSPQTASRSFTMVIYAKAKNGSGTETVTPTTAIHRTSGNVFTLAYTAPANGALFKGKLRIVVPTGWTAPSKSATSPGLVQTSMGSVAISGQSITITSLYLQPSATVTVSYGTIANGKTGVKVGGSGTYTFATKEASSSGGTLVSLAASPKVKLT